MNKSFKIFSLVILTATLTHSIFDLSKIKAEETESIQSVNESMENPNIKKLGSRRFMSLTENTKVISVFDVYGEKVIIVETDQDMEIIKSE